MIEKSRLQKALCLMVDEMLFSNDSPQEHMKDLWLCRRDDQASEPTLLYMNK